MVIFSIIFEAFFIKNRTTKGYNQNFKKKGRAPVDNKSNYWQ